MMKLRILPSSLAEPAQQPLTTFLINDRLAIDAGCLGIALPFRSQTQVTDIIVTHAHLDHIATLPTFLDNVFSVVREPIRLHATPETIAILHSNIFNDQVWPDFSRLSNDYGPVLRFMPLTLRQSSIIANLRVTPIEVNHQVQTVGLLLEAPAGTVVITSDTYHTEEIWQAANRQSNLRAVFTDVSFPNRLENLAAISGHLTPRALALELTKLQQPAKVYVVHLKTAFHAETSAELAALNLAHVRVAEIDREYAWD